MAYFIDETDYLEHYGRKGMKWYQHIFGENAAANRAYSKAAKTAGEFDKQATTYLAANEGRDRLKKAKDDLETWQNIDNTANNWKLLGKAKDYTEFKRIQKENAVKDASFKLLKLGVSTEEEYIALKDSFARSAKVLDKQFKKLSKSEYGRSLAEDLLKEFDETKTDDRFDVISERARTRNEKERSKEEKRKARG